jgi:spermidine/putrescine transport system permease protein
MLSKIGKTSPVAAIAVAWPILLLLVGFWLPIGIWIVKYGSAPRTISVFCSGLFLHALLTTALIATATTVSSLVLAYPIALLWWNSNRTVANWLTRILFLPLIVGLLARNYAWIGLLTGQDMVSSFGLVVIKAEQSLYTWRAVIIVMTYIFIPIAFFVLVYALSTISRFEIEAARTLGSTDREVLTKIVLPHTLRQSVIGAFLIFANALGYFVTPHMLGGGNFDMLGNLIWNNLIKLGLFDEASALALSLIIVLIPFYLIAFFLIIRSRQKVLGR